MNNRGMAFCELVDVNTEWESVLALGTRKNYAKGSRIDSRGYLCYLEKGQIRLTHFTSEGGEKILWYIGEGCLFGETVLLDPQPTESFFIAGADCVAYTFTKELIMKIFADRPDLLMNMLHTMARKLRILAAQSASLYLDDVLVRTCKFLALRIVPGSVPLMSNPGISRQQMASLLGVHRVTLYKVLRQQEEAGLFGPFNRQSVTILQPDVFYKMVNL